MALKLEKYNFNLPKELIAKKPASPRDAAGLLVYSRKDKKIVCDKFLNIGKYLPKNAVLVFNKTKVIPARIFLKKETGGRVEVLYLEEKGGAIEALTNRKLPIGSKLYFGSREILSVKGQRKNIYCLEPLIADIKGFFQKHGRMPIPPYIKNTSLPEKELREKYQAVFAERPGSSAAPTASLHFTKRLLKKLKESGLGMEFVVLHVGLGTFAPLTQENIEKGKLHEEYYEMSRKTYSFLRKAKKQGRPIIAVGTTVARALESGKLSGKTDLFIRPGYDFKMTDGLITNFHLPRSSLLMLVVAFAGRKEILDIYNKAIKNKFKFYSFGDGMLIL